MHPILKAIIVGSIAGLILTPVGGIAIGLLYYYTEK